VTRDRLHAALAEDVAYEVRRSPAAGVLEVLLDTDGGEQLIR